MEYDHRMPDYHERHPRSFRLTTTPIFWKTSKGASARLRPVRLSRSTRSWSSSTGPAAGTGSPARSSRAGVRRSSTAWPKTCATKSPRCGASRPGISEAVRKAGTGTISRVA